MRPIDTGATPSPNRPPPTGTRRLSLRRNVFWAFCGNAALAASQWGVLVALARLGDATMVGQFALGLAISAPIFMFFNLALRNAQASDARDEFMFGDYVALRLLTTGGAALAIGLTLAVLRPAPVTLAVVALVGVAKSFDALSDIFHALFQRVECMNLQARSMALNGLATLAVVALLLWLTDSVVIAALGSALVSLAVLLVVVLPAGARVLGDGEARRVWPRPVWSRAILRLAWLTLPAGIAFGVQSINLNVTRYAVQHYLSEADLGVYAALGYIGVAGYTVVSALAQAALPGLSRLYAAADVAGFVRLIARLSMLGAALGGAAIVAAAIAGRRFLDAIYGPEYGAANDVFVWLTVQMAIQFLNWFFEYGIHASRRFATLLPISLTVFGVNVALSIALVPSHGLIGAAWAFCAGMALQTLLKLAVLIWLVLRLRSDTAPLPVR